MEAATQELRRLRRLDRRTRLRAARGGLVIGPLFAAVVILGLGIGDQQLSVAYWLAAGSLVMWLSYWLSRKAERDYGVSAASGSVWLTCLSILAAAVALPSLGNSVGWSVLAWCGSALAVAVGLFVTNFVVFRPATSADKVRLGVPVVVIGAGSLTSYSLAEPLGQPAAIVLGLLAQTWAWRSMVTR